MTTVVLVDGDNISPDMIDMFERERASFVDNITHREVIMNNMTRKTGKWPPLYRITCVPASKNATDLEMTVRGMELSNGAAWLVVCSADADFMPLLRGAKRTGCRVAVCSAGGTTSSMLMGCADLYINRDTIPVISMLAGNLRTPGVTKEKASNDLGVSSESSVIRLAGVEKRVHKKYHENAEKAV